MLARTAVLCFTCLAATLLLFGFAPKPKVRASVAVVDSATVEMAVTVTGRLKSGDAIRYNFWKDGSLAVAKDSATMALRQTLPAPTCGTSGKYWVVARVVSGGTVGPQVKSNEVTVQAAACPEPPSVIDSVRIEPAQVSLSAGGSVQFQAVPSSR